jgi:hypothetical protein
MVKTEGHFKTEEEARRLADNLSELQSKRINKPNSRIKIGKRFHVKHLLQMESIVFKATRFTLNIT